MSEFAGTPSTPRQQGYRVERDEVEARIAALTTLGETTKALVATASRLGERLPMLGTAPPARHLALRLREAAGRHGLADAVAAANAELTSFQEALAAAAGTYDDHETGSEAVMRDRAEVRT